MRGKTLIGTAGTARFVARSTRNLLTKRRAHWWWSVLSLSFLAGVVVGASTQGYTLRWSAAPTRPPSRSQQAVIWVPGARRTGDLIYITRRHRHVAAFRVYSVTPDGKPVGPRPAGAGRAVYGYTRQAPLLLVTCEGAFDRQARQCLGHVVVAARLGQRPLSGLPDARATAIVDARR